MFGIEPSYLVIAVAIIALIYYFGFVRRRKEAEPAEDISKKMRAGVGDALTGVPADTSELKDALDAEEEVAPKLSADSAEPPVVKPEEVVVPEVKPVVEVTPEPEVPDLPPVSLDQPALAESIEPLVKTKGRDKPNVDLLLDTFVRFTPKDDVFTTDRLVQVAAFIDAEGLRDVVTADFYNAEKGLWLESFRGNNSCNAVVIKMQLASRKSEADELLVSRFLQLANQLAIEIDADVEMPDIVRVLDQTKMLSGLISRYDNTLALYVVTEAPFDLDLLKDILTPNGFAARGVNTYVKCVPGKEDPYFKISVAETDLTKIVLELDIPLCDPAINPLRDLFETANDLSCTFGGVLVDQSKNPITTAAATYISSELKKLAADMDSQGLALGSERTVKLFSRT